MPADVDVEDVKGTAVEAGKKVLEIYEADFNISYKSDNSPLTEADTKSNKIIVDYLTKEYPDIPVLSEESGRTAYDIRRGWNRLLVVDPLDGTKEFVNRNGEFTVNIALVEGGKPVAGVVYAPVLDRLYYAQKGKGAYREVGHGRERLPLESDRKGYVVVASRSHLNDETRKFIEAKKREHGDVHLLSSGSSMKICLVAEGSADCYPRLAPTMEWDTAAAHAVANEAGRKIVEYGTDRELTYNKEDLLNPWFIVE
jgi:3'(2'), 5'-bisphosphate nucleotidase